MGRIFWKLFAAIFLAATLGLLGAVVFYFLSDQDMGELFTESKAAVFLDASEAIVKNAGVNPALIVVNNWNQFKESPHITILDYQGKSLTSQLFSTGGTHRNVVTSDGKAYILATDVKASHRNLLRPSIYVPMISGALFGFIVSAFLAWYFTLPIRHLRWALEQVSKGKFETRVGRLMGTRRDEIADLGRDVDLMTAQIEQLVASRQRLFHDISHELRSPLARLQVASGLLRQNRSDAEQTLDRIDHEIERLNNLVEQILTLARLSSQTDFVTNDKVDVIELLSSIVDDAAFEAEARNRRVHLTAEGSFVSKVNGEMLCRAFENIIRNAVKYTKAETTVDVRAKYLTEQNSLQVSVEDRGVGVPPEMLSKIFEPFWRSDVNQSTIGFGLGLAIAKKTVEAHRGKIFAENLQGGGLCITIIVPMNA